MDKQGEKRPRDEAPVCLACKKPDGPFPALHPDCPHKYCAKCVRRADAKWCEYCRKDWNYACRAFNAPNGDAFVVECVAGNHLLSHTVIVHHANRRLGKTSESTVAYLQHKHPEFRAWLVKHGLRRDKTAGERARKFAARYAPAAYSVENGDGSWVVLGGTGPERRVVYLTDRGAEHAFISRHAHIYPRGKCISMPAVLAIHRAIQKQEAGEP